MFLTRVQFWILPGRKIYPHNNNNNKNTNPSTQSVISTQVMNSSSSLKEMHRFHLTLNTYNIILISPFFAQCQTLQNNRQTMAEFVRTSFIYNFGAKKRKKMKKKWSSFFCLFGKDCYKILLHRGRVWLSELLKCLSDNCNRSVLHNIHFSPSSPT